MEKKDLVVVDDGYHRFACWWLIVGIRGVGLYQAVTAGRKDLVVVCNGI